MLKIIESILRELISPSKNSSNVSKKHSINIQSSKLYISIARNKLGTMSSFISKTYWDFNYIYFEDEKIVLCKFKPKNRCFKLYRNNHNHQLQTGMSYYLKQINFDKDELPAKILLEKEKESNKKVFYKTILI